MSRRVEVLRGGTTVGGKPRRAREIFTFSRSSLRISLLPYIRWLEAPPPMLSERRPPAPAASPPRRRRLLLSNLDAEAFDAHVLERGRARDGRREDLGVLLPQYRRARPHHRRRPFSPAQAPDGRRARARHGEAHGATEGDPGAQGEAHPARGWRAREAVPVRVRCAPRVLQERAGGAVPVHHRRRALRLQLRPGGGRRGSRRWWCRWWRRARATVHSAHLDGDGARGGGVGRSREGSRGDEDHRRRSRRLAADSSERRAGRTPRVHG